MWPNVVEIDVCDDKAALEQHSNPSWQGRVTVLFRYVLKFVASPFSSINKYLCKVNTFLNLFNSVSYPIARKKILFVCGLKFDILEL